MKFSEFISQALITCVLATSLITPQAKASDVVVGTFGGVWEVNFRLCVATPFEKLTGKKVAIVVGTPSQWLSQIAASPAKPPLDMMVVQPDNALDAAKRGLVVRNDPARLPNLKQIPSKFSDSVDGYGAAFNYGALGILYNTKTVKNPPKSWKEFIDGTTSGKWKAAMPGIQSANGAVYALWLFAQQSGGSSSNIAPGFAHLKKMTASGNLVQWNDVNQVLNSLKSGDIDVAVYWDGRAWTFAEENKDFTFISPAPGAIVSIGFLQKVKGGADEAWDVINYAMSVEAQTCFGNKMRYGMSNPGVVFEPKVKPVVTELSNVIFPPYREFPQYQSQWVEQWNKEIGR